MIGTLFVSFGGKLIIGLLILAGDHSLTLRCGECSESERNPGMVMQYTEDYVTITYQQALQLGLEELQKNPARLKITGEVSTLLWSTIRYSVNHVTMVGYEQPKASVWFTEATGFLVNVSLPVLTFKGEYTLDLYNGPWFEYSRGGAISVTILGTTLEFRREMTLNQNKDVMKWTTPNCSASIKDFIVDLLDPASNSDVGSVQWDKEIMDLEEEFCAIIKRRIDMEEHLSVNLANDIYLDWTMLRQPAIYDGYFEYHCIGEVRYRGDAKRFGRLPQPQLLERPSGLVVYRMSDFVFNSFGDVVHNHKLLSFRYTQLDLPENRKHLLDTTCELECFGKLFPNASAMWPTSSVEISVATSEAPYVQITSDSFKVIFGFNIEAYARVTSDSAPRIFSVHLFMSAHVVPSIKNNRIRFERQHEDANITVIESNIGDLREDDLRVVINQALQKVVVPLVKQFAVDGFDHELSKLIFIDECEAELTKGDLSFLINSMEVKEQKSYVDPPGKQHTLGESVGEFFSSILPILTAIAALCFYVILKLKFL